MFDYYAFDLDGTLLSDEKIITDDCIDSINYVRGKGASVILISSRHYDEILPFASQLHLQNNDFIVSCDGQYIFNGSGKLLQTMPFLSINDVAAVFNKFGEYVSFFTERYDYAFSGEKNVSGLSKLKLTLSENERIKKGVDGRKFGRIYLLSPYRNLQIEKIVISKSFNGDLPAYNTIAFSGRTEFVHKEVSKYNALLYLRKSYGIVFDNLIYFGDDYNDYPCFKNLPNTAVVCTAPEELKSLAGFITDRNISKAIISL